MGQKRRKLMLLAIDASPAERMTRWIEDGSLPNLARLRAAGAHGRIDSTAEYLAGTPWPTFYTGTYPPEHGWMFYLAWRPDLMRFVRATPDWQPIEPFYRNFPLDGPRVIAIDVPITYAPKPFNGVELTGWGTHDKIGAPGAYPLGLLDRVRKEIGPMPIPDEFAGLQGSRELLDLRDDLIDAADWHSRAGRMLMRENDWDLFMLGFGSVHRAGHKLWNHHGAAGPVTDAEKAELDDAMRQVAIATDKAVGELIEAAGDDVNVIVFSLHGMTENFSVQPLFGRMLRRILTGQREDDPETIAPSPISRLRETIPLGVRARVKARLPFSLQDSMTMYWRSEKRDWARTKAFVLAGDLEGLIQVNLKGRERDGIVEPGAEYDALLEEIAAGLETFVDMDTGEPLVRDINRGRDIWPEAVLRRTMPDLLVRSRIRSARDIRGFRSEKFGTVRNYDFGNYVDGRPGHHVGEGWFAAAGADISGRGELARIHEFDLLASVHELIGQPMRPEMRGAPVEALSPGGGESAP
ncbi:alkaline phosphatase family protein [Tropicimonas sediminicola]|uniref:Predicted phosphohydrolase or phosphomutase, AlkP superfamily n=1 Tax=Tropicimonas sediminicola TaxID=1031541 RepID=A0A239LVD8_9RHOB|nr:alkaline phosphatase family protein [Tropicimonas sediminicola]SNT33584.1 Predicted phosphohydrolase or phosphomutase, AlkP superfamily [Tropicimonas sediminicola]